MQKIITGR